MTASRPGRFLLGAGLFVGVVASVAYTLGLKPSALPPALLDIAAYKLAMVAALGLVGVGAGITRHARRRAATQVAGSHTPGALPEGTSPMAPIQRRDAEEARRDPEAR